MPIIPSILIISVYETRIEDKLYNQRLNYSTNFWRTTMALIGINDYFDLILTNEGLENQLNAIKNKYGLY